MTVKKGEKLSFLYAFLFHEGDAESAGIAETYDRWVEAVANMRARAGGNN
tara:strand:- start:666 stop:815 length:150 start_codon:yes stop_codon:yes gene_type:complete